MGKEYVHVCQINDKVVGVFKREIKAQDELMVLLKDMIMRKFEASPGLFRSMTSRTRISNITWSSRRRQQAIFGIFASIDEFPVS